MYNYTAFIQTLSTGCILLKLSFKKKTEKTPQLKPFYLPSIHRAVKKDSHTEV